MRNIKPTKENKMKKQIGIFVTIIMLGIVSTGCTKTSGLVIGPVSYLTGKSNFTSMQLRVKDRIRLSNMAEETPRNKSL